MSPTCFTFVAGLTQSMAWPFRSLDLPSMMQVKWRHEPAVARQPFIWLDNGQCVLISINKSCSLSHRKHSLCYVTPNGQNFCKNTTLRTFPNILGLMYNSDILLYSVTIIKKKTLFIQNTECFNPIYFSVTWNGVTLLTMFTCAICYSFGYCYVTQYIGYGSENAQQVLLGVSLLTKGEEHTTHQGPTLDQDYAISFYFTQ